MKLKEANKKSRRETTFRFPFDIDTRYFLVLAAVFFILSIKPVSEYLFSSFTPKRLEVHIRSTLEKDMKLADQLFSNKPLFDSFYHQQAHEKTLERLSALPFGVFCFRSHKLVYWNTVHSGNPIDSFPQGIPTPYRNRNGFYVALQRSLDSASTVLFLFRIKNDYGFSSRYFSRNFICADPENDYNLQLTSDSVSSSIPLKIKGRTVWYLSRNNDLFMVNDKNGWRLFFRALFFILFGVSIHTYYKVEVKKKNTLFIFSLLLATALGIRALTYFFGFPNSFEEFALFSPEYFASDSLNRSLGDLFINVCLLFWILLFFLINVQGKVVNLRKHPFRFHLGILAFVFTTVAAWYHGLLIRRLVEDSVIHFDTTYFNRLDLFSLIGILTFMVMFVNVVYLAIIARNYFTVCFPASWIKYLLLLIAGVVFLLLTANTSDAFTGYSVCFILALLYLMQDLNYLKTKFDFSSYKLLIWMIFISAFGAFFLVILINQKERSDREVFAQQLVNKSDSLSEVKLNSIRESIEADTTLHPFSSSDPGGQSALLRIQNVVTALCGMRPGCRARWYIPSTIPSQTTDSCSNSIVLHFKMATGDTTCLLCIEKIRDYETGAGSSWLSNSNSDQLRSEMYSYAIYRKGLLDEHQGVRVFPYRLDRKDGMKNSGTVHFSYSSGDSQLWLRDEITDTDVVVWKKYNPLYLFTTLFAYIFFIYFVTVSLYILGNIIARSNLHWKRFLNLLSLNLRLRIHFSILIVELFSFAIIGYISTQFLSGKVNERMKLELSTNTFQIQKEISQWPDLVTSTGQASGQAGSLHVRELQEMADRYGSSLNMYQINNGELQYAAMPELFSREIFSRRLDASIWHAMKTGNQNVLIREEQVGSLKYLCSYGLLQNADRQAIGIVQLPLFLSNAELRTETSTITTTLINIYIFVFLASALIAYFLTKSVTRPFSYIVKQFTKINLTKTNEPLQWFDSDEIGLLIKEYNRMLRKLENSTVLLAKTEREMAWREMAKQVAHEIKNPLTPMKLSLQMLERAIHNKAANVDEIAMKVSKTLVEQIDNLSLIASNFSDFAKLPVSKNEVFSLNNLLYAVTGMYHDDQHNDFEFQIPEYEIFIFADRSQLIRVLTNIIQNAIQSIPEERKGKIALYVSKIRNNFIRMAISDNGEGISDDKAANLFQPYFTTKTSGTGLGLAMCKDIIEECGGKISFQSRLNEGTTFFIDLPIYDVES